MEVTTYHCAVTKNFATNETSCTVFFDFNDFFCPISKQLNEKFSEAMGIIDNIDMKRHQQE